MTPIKIESKEIQALLVHKPAIPKLQSMDASSLLADLDEEDEFINVVVKRGLYQAKEEKAYVRWEGKGVQT